MRSYTAELLLPLATATSAELKHPAGVSNSRLTELRSMKAVVPKGKELFLNPLRDRTLSPGNIKAAQDRHQRREPLLE